MSATTPEPLPAAGLHSLRRDTGLVPELVLLPVPVSEPPYDDEAAARTGPHLSVVTSSPVPVGPLAALPALRLVAAPVAQAPADDPAVPAVRPVARALVQGLLEVLAGVRPVTQLRRRTSLDLYADLEELVQEQPRPAGTRPSTGAVLSLHVQHVSPAVAEICATVRRGTRAGALALRLELTGGAWCCTAVCGLGPALPRPRADTEDEDA